MATNARRIKNPVLFVCDLQEKFRPAIAHFPHLLTTTQRLLRASSALSIPVLATTQSRAKLGSTCPELELSTTYPLVADVDKTAFSMWVPDVVSALDRLPRSSGGTEKDDGKTVWDVLLVGIETHICVLQTALDALREGQRVWVVQDGVSSCNEEERAVALQRMRQEGVRVTTSESLIYELMGDAGDPAFKEIAGLIKECKDSNKAGLKALCRI